MPTKTVELPISGMTCASCARSVERGLQKVAGVASASVNIATSTKPAVRLRFRKPYRTS